MKNQFESFCLLVLTLGALVLPLISTAWAAPQLPNTAPAQPPTAKRDLTEGLLDLLTEPSATEKSDRPAQPPTPSPRPASENTSKDGASPGLQSTLVPDAARIDDTQIGEDLGALRQHPLAEVQLEMQTAAGWLRSRSSKEKTQDLQRNIVARLDQLIDDLEKQAPESSSSSASLTNDVPQSKPSEQKRQTEPTGSRSQLAEATDRQTGPRSSSSTQPDAAGQNDPSPEGPSSERSQPGRNAIVDLNDPTALQRSVWGNLPDRVRDQMQSRMVERFLPSYREDIEAYYRALVK